MRLKTEEIITARKILLVNNKKDSVCVALEKKLTTYNFDVFISTDIPDTTRQFSYIFILNDLEAAHKHIHHPPLEKTKTLIVLYNRKKELLRFQQALTISNDYNTKVVNLDLDQKTDESIETMLWFLFSHSGEQSLDLVRTILLKKKPRRQIYHFSWHISKKKAFFLSVLALLCFQLFFLLPVFASSICIVASVRSLRNNDMDGAKKYAGIASPFVSLSNGSYALARPLFSFFYVALLPDDIMLIENKSYQFVQKSIATAENTEKMIPFMFVGDKTPLETQQLKSRIMLLKQQMTDLATISDTLSEKITHYSIPPLKKIAIAFNDIHNVLDQTNKIMSHIDTLIGGSDEKKYLVLFQNNMELRPGGGFIGSYGIITFKNYSITDFSVHDVYDADGQLLAHVEPPFALKTYMNQPHWFLRDSNFSPDFETNFKQAAFFLDKELGIKNFSGGVAITTTAIASLIDSMGGVYLPDYNETITKDNFYIKTQLQSESKFFPGSKQKQDFLSDLVTMLMNKLSSVPPAKIGAAIKQAFDEKQIAMFVTDEITQKDIDATGYSGKLAIPNCASSNNTDQKNCFADSIFPVDANIGINKANFFVSRLVSVALRISPDGSVEHIVKTAFRNDSSGSIFPGGTYKNYYQLYVPVDSSVTDIHIDGVKTTDYQESTSTGDFRTIGVYVEIPPKTTREVTIDYKLTKTIPTGDSLYQLVVQKQIGAANSDFVLQVSIPPTIHIVEKNFAAVAKESSLVYNTTLSNDRIFLIQLTRE